MANLDELVTSCTDEQREAFMSDEYRQMCMQKFANFIDAEGEVDEDQLAEAIMAATLEERVETLGITKENATRFADQLGIELPLKAEGFLSLCRWCSAEGVANKYETPVVGSVLGSGLDGRNGLQSVEQAVKTIVACGVEGTLRKGDEYAVTHVWEKCVPSMNPTSYRTCQRAARAAIAPLARFAEPAGNTRTICLEALARIVSGYEDAAKQLSTEPSFASALEGALNADSANEQQSGLIAASSMAAWPSTMNVVADKHLLRIGELATYEAVGSFSAVQSLSLSVLCQLSCRAGKQVLGRIAALFSRYQMEALLAVEPRHRVMEGDADRLDFQILCLNLIGETTNDGSRIYDVAFRKCVEQGVIEALVQSLDASAHKQEWPIGSNCFRRPISMLHCVRSACAAGCAGALRGTIQALAELLLDDEFASEAISTFQALCASRRNVDAIAAHPTLSKQLAEIANESAISGDGELAELVDRLQKTITSKLAELPALYEVEDAAEMLGGKLNVMLRGISTTSGTVRCADFNDAIENMLNSEIEVIVFNGEHPAFSPPGPEDGTYVDLSTSFTQVIVRAMKASSVKAWKEKSRGAVVPEIMAAGFVGSEPAATEAQAAWAGVASEFLSRVLLFRNAPNAYEPESVARNGWDAARITGTRQVVSIGLGEAEVKEDFAAMAEGRVETAVDTWTVYPASVNEACAAETADMWGGLALTTPCALNAETRVLSAADGSWSLYFDTTENEWKLR